MLGLAELKRPTAYWPAVYAKLGMFLPSPELAEHQYDLGAAVTGSATSPDAHFHQALLTDQKPVNRKSL